MAVELATAYISLVPSLKGAGREIGKQLGAADVQGQVAKAGRTSGLTWARNAVLGIGAAGLAATGTVVGIALSKGFNRSIQLQEAEKKLEGLGHSAETVAQISDDALGAVRGTAFGMGEAMTAAANAVAAGVKPGQDLERTLTLVGDAATIAGAEFGEMGAIWNKVAASNKVQMDSINQLHDRGVPALQFLAAELGVTAEEAAKMASAGKIDFATFQAAMETGLGGAAQKSGETFRGAAANVMAALGRLGAMFTGPIVAAGPSLFQSLAGAIDTLGVVLQPVAEKFGELLAPAVERFAATLGQLDFGAMFAQITSGQGALGALVGGFSSVADSARWMRDEVVGGVAAMVAAFQAGDGDITSTGIAGFLESIGATAREVWDLIAGSDLPGQFLALASAVSPLGIVFRALEPQLPVIAEALGRVAVALTSGLLDALPLLVPSVVALSVAFSSVLAALVPVATWALELAASLVSMRPLVLGAIAAFLGFKAVTGIIAGVRAVQLGLVAATYGTQGAMLVAGGSARVYGLAMSALRIKTLALSIVQKGAAAAQWLLNAAMTANPIGLIIAGVAALIAAFVLLWKNNEGFRNFFIGMWEGIKSAAQAVANWFTGTLLPIFQKVWNGIRAAISVAWTVIRVIFVTIATAVTLLLVRPMQAFWKNVVVPVWNGIRTAIGAAWGWIRDKVFTPISNRVGALVTLFQNFWKKTIAPAWEGIKTAIGSAWNWIRDRVFTVVTSRLSDLSGKFEGFKTKATGAWDSVKTALSNAWSWLRDNVFSKFTGVVQALGTTFEDTQKVIKTAWGKIRSAAAGPVNFVIETVYMNGIKKTWDSIADAVGLDLKLPSVSKIATFANGSEDHRAQIAPAGAMRLWAEPETGGEAYIPLAASKRGRSTQILGAVANKFGYSLTPFANGGFFGTVGDWISGAVSNAGNLIENIANFLADPASGIRNLILKPVEALFSQVMGGPLGQMLVELPKKAITGLIEKAKSLIGLGDADGKGPLTELGGGKWIKPSRGRITSRFGPRWGAFHNGVDWAGAPGRITTAVRGGRVSRVGWNVGYGNTGLGVLINHGGGYESYYGHNPIGGVMVKPGQIVAAGQRVGTEGATGNVTGVHLHNSIFKNGRAINPLNLYDNGGWLPSGALGLNLSGRPEAVLTPEESAGLKAGLANGGPLVDTLIVRDERTAINELESLARRRNSQARLSAVVR